MTKSIIGDNIIHKIRQKYLRFRFDEVPVTNDLDLRQVRMNSREVGYCDMKRFFSLAIRLKR